MNYRSRRFGYLLFLLSMVSAIAACRKESTEEDMPQPQPPVTPGLFGTPIGLDVSGVVLDEAGAPVQGATVQAGFGVQSTVTDDNGVFQFFGITGYTGLGLVRVSKPGYVSGARSFLPVGGSNTVRVVLLSSQTAGEIDGALGGQLQAGGVTVDLVGGGFVRDGAPYTGTVSVRVRTVDPSDPGQRPGSSVAVRSDAVAVLSHFAMVAIELTDAVGVPVDLAPGFTAQVRMPIPAALQGSAPSQSELWSYDEAAGYWRQEGTASRDGAEYVAQVPHFSYWSVADWSQFIELKGRIYSKPITSGGKPVSGALVTVTSSAMGDVFTFTGPDGHFAQYVPAGDLSIAVGISCVNGEFQQVFSQGLGQLTGSTDLWNVPLNSQLTTDLFGTVVNCNGLVAEQAYLLADGRPVFTDNGLFWFTTCTGGSATLVGIDPEATTVGPPQTVPVTGALLNVGLLPACNGAGVDAHLNPLVQYGTVVDVEGNLYRTIQPGGPGGREWMAENLRTSTFANGDPIPNLPDPTAWNNNNTPAWAHLDNNAQFNYPYGKLYNFHTAIDPRKVCPTGWHVPTDEEWKSLEMLLGLQDPVELDDTGLRGVATNVGGKMKTTGTQFWTAPNDEATNEIGFSAIKAGAVVPVGSELGFDPVGASFWSSTENPDQQVCCAYARGVGYEILLPGTTSWGNYRSIQDKDFGLSIRCISDQ